MSKEETKTKLASFPPSTMAAMKYFFFPQLMLFISSAGVNPHSPIVCGSGLPCAELCSPRSSLLLLLEEPIYGATMKVQRRIPREHNLGRGRQMVPPPTSGQGRVSWGRSLKQAVTGVPVRHHQLLFLHGAAQQLWHSRAPAATAPCFVFFICKHFPF